MRGVLRHAVREREGGVGEARGRGGIVVRKALG